MTAKLTEEEYDKLARSDCFVCRIVGGKPLIPNPHIVYEDDDVIAFLSQVMSQEGQCVVCPKRHVERFESEMSTLEWQHLQDVVQRVAEAISKSTGAIRMYVASLGSPERNPHVHIHVCPCPEGTPFDQQQMEAMKKVIEVDDKRMVELAEKVRFELGL